jgi:hypothetical protein
MSALELALAEVPRPASATLPQPLRDLGNWSMLKLVHTAVLPSGNNPEYHCFTSTLAHNPKL